MYIINLGSSCIYPLEANNPIKEESVMSGKLEPTNSPYAMAKIAAIEMGNALKSQYGHKIINLMPTNLYGPNDNFDLKTSHVLPALIRGKIFLPLMIFPKKYEETSVKIAKKKLKQIKNTTVDIPDDPELLVPSSSYFPIKSPV